MSIIGMNLALNLSYFAFKYRFFFRHTTPLFSAGRILAIFFTTLSFHNLSVKKGSEGEGYRVNLNELFDNDEHFLFDNLHFKSLVKHTADNYTHLVNPNFDLSGIQADKDLLNLALK